MDGKLTLWVAEFLTKFKECGVDPSDAACFLVGLISDNDDLPDVDKVISSMATTPEEYGRHFR